MKALSIREPWASLIAQGVKTIETRTWNTKVRERVVLCASKSPRGPLSGMAFATAIIADCRPMRDEDERAACCAPYPRARSWVLKEVQLIEPFPVKGMLGFFEVDEGRVRRKG